MAYSTCTYNPIEDEAVREYMSNPPSHTNTHTLLLTI